jgi:hypothetical protein
MGEGEAVGDGEAVGEGEPVGDGDPVGEGDGDPVGDGEPVGEGELVGEGDPVGEGEPVGEGDPVGESEAVGDGDLVGTGRALAAAWPVPRTATKMPVATAHPPACTAAVRHRPCGCLGARPCHSWVAAPRSPATGGVIRIRRNTGPDGSLLTALKARQDCGRRR